MLQAENNRKYDIICAGMALVDCIIKGFDPNPVSASGYRAASCTLNIGGEALNEAITASKLGMRTAILCALGNDEAGEMNFRALANAGVDTGLIRRSEQPTPVTTMFVREDGGRQSITNSAHRYNFHPERCCSCLADSRALILGSLFRAPFDDPAVIHAVLSSAKAADLLIFADTKLPNFRFLKLEDLHDSLPMIDYITPNEDEARYYTGKHDPEDMADVFLRHGISHVVIKLGKEGCFYKDAARSMLLPACEVQAVDATGAGDNFVAGFASELLRGSPVAEALHFANACGAICASAVGACTALHDRDQVKRFLQAQQQKQMLSL